MREIDKAKEAETEWKHEPFSMYYILHVLFVGQKRMVYEQSNKGDKWLMHN